MENLGDLGSAHCVSLLELKTKVKIPVELNLGFFQIGIKGVEIQPFLLFRVA